MRTLPAAIALAGVLAISGFAAAQEHDGHDDHDDHDHHTAEVGTISVTHPWARAASAGQSTLVFMEIENAGDADILEDIHTDIAASASVVGVSFAGGDQSLQPLEEFEIPSGDFDFDPAGVAILLEGLTTALEEGDEFELELVFHSAGELPLHVEVQSATATQHSHAGHSH
ncbi:copper chaperone PCu(A)C [Pelagibacterium mangrovi]|uniref:copper chaperone PCu(A)C n=1 Tax=Pelagibacterium mangrovi TaxID=3119828 RepID=UPI002FC6F61B